MLRVILFLAGIALLVILLWHLGPSEIVASLERIGWYSIPVLALYAANQFVRALALRVCVLRPGLLAYRDALATRLSGEAIQSLTLTGPLLAEPTRAWLLTRRGLTLQEGFAAAITEYLINSFVTAAMSIAGLVYVVRRFEPASAIAGLAISIIVLFSAFLVAAAIAIIRRFYLLGTVIAWLARIGVLRGRLRPDMPWINRMEDLLLAVLRDRPGRFVSIALLDTAAQGLLVLELLCLFRALDVASTALTACLVEASTKIIDIAFLFVPLQVGVAEGTYALVFTVMGLPSAAGFAVAFVRRIRSLVVATVGLVTLALLTREVRNH